jgi:hypothetical protein
MSADKETQALPEARLSHFSKGRLRLRINAKRGDDDFFQHAREALKSQYGDNSIEVNPVTASLLIVDDRVSPDSVALVARESELFVLHREPETHPKAFYSIINPIKAADDQLQRFSGGGLDIATAVFLALLVHGIIEIIRGNFKTPPWYTAFWYAFGLFTKTLMEKPEA